LGFFLPERKSTTKKRRRGWLEDVTAAEEVAAVEDKGLVGDKGQEEDEATVGTTTKAEGEAAAAEIKEGEATKAEDEGAEVTKGEDEGPKEEADLAASGCSSSR
jgi:hypothetical protein